MTDQQQEPEYLTPAQAALQLRVTTTTIRQWARSGRLRFTSTPLGRLYRVRDVNRLAEKR